MKPTVPHIDPRTHLLASGLTEKQAGAIVKTSNEIAAGRIEEVRYELAQWHAYLALYLLIQTGIVLLALILMQTIQEPQRDNVLVEHSRLDFKVRAVQTLTSDESQRFRGGPK